ncbi:unnamed protein product [Meloidogyne enterolobii]|uniref:Uncharacterized protein n=1 Tax=Meloidogyne enterolobii TaxID=390850 RepID=A0ACB0YEZ3_MELEN
MHHATRMLLIPEDFYKSLIGIDNPEEKANNADGTALGLFRERLQSTENNSILDPHTKAARYEQDFKRYNKLVRDKEEKPINVKLKNFEEIVETLNKNVDKNNDTNNIETNKPIQKIVRKRRKKISGFKINKKLLPGKLKVPPRGIADKNIEVESDYFSQESDPTTSEQALKYVKENSRSLGITDDLKIAKIIGGQEPLYNSNVEKIIKYILSNKSVRKKPIPIGYNEFIRRIDNHTYLKDLLLPPSSSSKQTGNGTFSFKPSLWKNQKRNE